MQFEIEFKKYIVECLKAYNNYPHKILIDKNIDIYIQVYNNVFLIQCKFDKTRPTISEINNFISNCNLIKNQNIMYTYYPIYLSRISPIINTNNNSTNIYLYDYPIEYFQIYKDFEHLLMKLYNHIVNISGCRLYLKDYQSDDVLMSYFI